MESLSVPKKITLFVAQMGKCMATCVPCVKTSSEYRVLECRREKGTYSNLIELACFIDGQTGKGVQEVTWRM